MHHDNPAAEGQSSPPLPQRATVGQRMRSAHRLASQVQKPAEGVPAYTRWINRPLARYVAAGAAALGWTPNMVTLFSLLLSAIGIVLILAAPSTWWIGIPTALALAAGYLFDSADGQLARLTGRSGPAGEWLDHVVDAIRTPAIHIAVALGVLWQTGNNLVVAAALAMSVVSSGQFMSQMLADQMLRRAGTAPRRGTTRTSWTLLPTDPGLWAWSFTLWGMPTLFAMAYVTLVAINCLHAALSAARRRQDLLSITPSGD